MNPEVEDPTVPHSQNYLVGKFCHVAPQQGGSSKRRRGRRKIDGVTTRKRKLSEEQASMLEQCFGSEHRLETGRKDQLAAELGLDPRQVAVWFQNRRARWRSKKMEEDYFKLRCDHQTVVLENRILETQLIKLKEQLGVAEKEIRRLSEHHQRGCTSNSPMSSSVSMDINFLVSPSFFGEFAGDHEGLENVFCDPWNGDHIDWDQWGNNLCFM